MRIVDDVNVYYGEELLNLLVGDGVGISYVVWNFFVWGFVLSVIWLIVVMCVCVVKDE